jgi:predicted DNA-binding transcriptional regulator AlpA
MSLITQDFYTAQELAELKGVTLRSVYSWIKKGLAPRHEKLGGLYWFYRKEADAFERPKRGKKVCE